MRTTLFISVLYFIFAGCSLVNAGNALDDGKIFVRLGNEMHLSMPSVYFGAYQSEFSYYPNWRRIVIDSDTYLIQYKNWNGFYWKIDGKNNAVYKVSGSVEEKIPIEGIIFTPTDTVYLIFVSPYLEINTDSAEARLVFNDTELMSKDEFQVLKVSKGVFHLRCKIWNKFFWKIDALQKKVYAVTNGVFGKLSAGIGIEKELSAFVSDRLDTEAAEAEITKTAIAESSRGIVIPFGKEVIKADGYEIIYKSPVRFTVPTVSMLLKYRPYVKEHFGYDQEKYDFFDIVEDVNSEIGVAKIFEDKVWVGFSYYEGEGWEGYGGIGFYDIKKHLLGVLRHPALVDCSVKDLFVDGKRIYVQTMGNYEGASTICNGMIVIDRKNLSVEALVPPGGEILWSKDEPSDAAEFYNRPIEEIYRDKRFVPEQVRSWSDREIKEIKKIGLEQYMIGMAKTEEAERKRAVSNSTIVVNQTVTSEDLMESFASHLSIVIPKDNLYPWDYGINFFGKNSLPNRCRSLGFSSVSFNILGNMEGDFAIPQLYPPTATMIPNKDEPWAYAEKGKVWTLETSKSIILITLEDFESKPLRCLTERGKVMDNRYFHLDALFDSITFNATVKKLNE